MPETGSPYDEPGPLRVTSLEEVVTLVPFLLGFTPSRSLVALGAPTGPAIRVDLAPADQSVEDQDATASASGERIASVMTRNGVETVILIGYGDSEPVTAFGTIVEARLREAGVEVPQGVRVQDDRFWSFTCTDTACCPPEGTLLNSQTSVVAAEAVLRGFSVAASREEVIASLDPVSEPEADRVRDAISQVSDHLTARTRGLNPAARRLYLIEQGEALIDSVYERVRAGTTFETFDNHDIARLLILLQEIYNRDLAMTGIKAPHTTQFLEFWRQVLRRALPGMVSAPACLTAQAAIYRGDGAVANRALERGAQDDPNYRMLILLGTVVQTGMHPNTLPEFTREAVTEGYRAEIEQLRREAASHDKSGTEPGEPR